MKAKFFNTVAAAIVLSLTASIGFADTSQIPSIPSVPAPPSIPTVPVLTGNNGDAGDPNNNVIAQAAITAPAAAPTITTSDDTTVPPAEQVAPVAAPVEQASPEQTSPEQTPAASKPNPLGSTANSRTAFSQVVRNLMPLEPAQILTLRSLFDQSQRAVAQYPGTPPKPTSSSILVNMSPGAAPPVIRLRSGYVTSMVFLDSTGQPWPVVGYDLGNPKAFNIQPSAPDGKSATLIVQALERYQQGNLAIMLKGQSTPVMLTLMPGQHAVDYRVDLRIPGLGPNAIVSMSGLPQTESPVLMDFLDGTPPNGAKLLNVDGAPAQAWVYQGYLYLRTRVTILSPGWISSMNSPDGTHVYELAKTPIVLASHRGAMVQLSIKGL